MSDIRDSDERDTHTLLTKIMPQHFWAGEQAPPDAEVYSCLLCRDTGWLIGEEGAYPCDCRKAKLLTAAKVAAGLPSALCRDHLADFRLDYYADHLQNGEGRSFRQLAESALEACHYFVDGILANEERRGLFLQGEVGRGKTFLAAAMVNMLVENGRKVLFVVVPDFLDRLRYSYDTAASLSEEEVMKRVQKAQVLVLDDLGSHNYSEWTKNKIYSLVNYRLNHNLPIIITSNLGLDDLKDILGLRTVSRIVECCDFYLLCSDKDNRLKVRSANAR